MNRAKWHAWPWTTPKYKSSAEHLSCLCIWSFLPLSSIQLTTDCWKVLSAISLSVITTVAPRSDPGLGLRAGGHVPFHTAALSPCSRAHCYKKEDVLQWVTGKGWIKKKGWLTSDRFSFFSTHMSEKLNLLNVKSVLSCCWREYIIRYLHFFCTLILDNILFWPCCQWIWIQEYCF